MGGLSEFVLAKGTCCSSAHHPGKINLIYNFAAQQPAMCLIDKEGDAARLIANSMPCVSCVYWRARD
jgi:hypothetical protein